MGHFVPSTEEVNTLRKVSQQSSMPTNREIFNCFEIIGEMGDIVAYHKTLPVKDFPGYEVFIVSGDKSFQPIHCSEKSLEQAMVLALRAYINYLKKAQLS